MSLLGVIFDFDGVIADTERLHLQAFQQVLADGPLTLTEEAYDTRYLGYDDAGVFAALAADHGGAPLGRGSRAHGRGEGTPLRRPRSCGGRSCSRTPPSASRAWRGT